MGKGKWVGICVLCEKPVYSKECIPKEFMGVNGFVVEKFCKECHRDYQLSNLLKSENTE